MYGFEDNNGMPFIVYKCIRRPILHIISFPPHYHIDIGGRNLQEWIQGIMKVSRPSSTITGIPKMVLKL